MRTKSNDVLSHSCGLRLPSSIPDFGKGMVAFAFRHRRPHDQCNLDGAILHLLARPQKACFLSQSDEMPIA